MSKSSNSSAIQAAINSVVEPLEQRRMLSAGAVVTIVGTRRADVITVERTADNHYDVSVNGVHSTYRASRVRAFNVLGGRGDDVLAISNSNGGVTAARSLDGGAGNDTVVGGNGNDTLAGGAGLDVIQGRGGNDL